jgi:hypothetical protein
LLEGGRRVLAWFRRRREYRERVEAKASRLIETLGDDAWPTIYAESRDMSATDEERLFAMSVRRAIERRLGMAPREDTATRYPDWRNC